MIFPWLRNPGSAAVDTVDSNNNKKQTNPKSHTRTMAMEMAVGSTGAAHQAPSTKRRLSTFMILFVCFLLFSTPISHLNISISRSALRARARAVFAQVMHMKPPSTKVNVVCLSCAVLGDAASMLSFTLHAEHTHSTCDRNLHFVHGSSKWRFSDHAIQLPTFRFL